MPKLSTCRCIHTDRTRELVKSMFYDGIACKPQSMAKQIAYLADLKYALLRALQRIARERLARQLRKRNDVKRKHSVQSSGCLKATANESCTT